MTRLVVKHWDSLSELRRHAAAWDDLWLRSDVTLPTAQARLIATWCESFADGRPFRATVVEEDGQLVAALPLVDQSRMAIRVAALPGDHWSSAGDFLLDPHTDRERVCAALLRDLRHHGRRWLWFDAVPIETARWRSLLTALDQRQVAYARRGRFVVNRTRIGSRWEKYLAGRSYNHRRQIRRAAARALKQGALELTCHAWLTPERVEELLTLCFAIEASGWKGRAASAVCDTPAAMAFYLEQGRQLAARGQLRVTLLRLEDRPIAFEYGWEAKGVYCSAKVGYDERFAELSPGQLLRALLMEQFHHDSNVHWFDFFGPASPATSKWATEQYPVDRLVVSLRGGLDRALLAAYRHGWPLVRAMREAGARMTGRQPSREPQPGWPEGAADTPLPSAPAGV